MLEMHVEMSEIAVIYGNDNFAPFLFQSLCELICVVVVLLPWYPGGGYSSMIWVGTCRWDLKSRPIFIPNFAEKWDPFLYQSQKF